MELIEFTKRETEFIKQVAKDLEISESLVITQALRIFQLIHEKVYIMNANMDHPIHQRRKEFLWKDSV